MRLIAFALTMFVIISPAAAQGWQEYTSPDKSFTVVFPAAPQIEATMLEIAGRMVPARTYTARADKGVFRVTVAELANSGLMEAAVMNDAIQAASRGGEVKVNFPHRIYQVYGRQLSVQGADGSRSTIAMFDTNGRFYQIEAKVLAGGDDTDLIRFQQSLVFDRKLSNRSADTVRAIKENCSGPNNPAGLDDPRCKPK